MGHSLLIEDGVGVYRTILGHSLLIEDGVGDDRTAYDGTF